MAKTQTFADKAKKKKGTSDFISVKVVTAHKTPKGSFNYSERFVKVKDLAEVEKTIS